MQTLRSGEYVAGGHQDVVLQMIEAAQMPIDKRAKSQKYDQYADLIGHHTRAIVRGGLFAMSGTGVIIGKTGNQ